MNWPKTERLFYKRTDVGDAADFYKICKDKRVASLANVRNLKGLHDAEAVVESFDYSRDSRTIKSIDTMRTIGFISSKKFSEFKVRGYNQQYEISIMIFPQYQKMGYGKEAFEWFVNYTFAISPQAIVVCKVFDDNAGSMRTVSKYMKKIKHNKEDGKITYFATDKAYFEKKLKEIERTKNGK